MTFSCCVFGSILLGDFLYNFEALLVSRVPIGLRMGLFWVPGGAKLVHNLGPWWHHGSRVAPRLQKGVILGHFGVCFESILGVFFARNFVQHALRLFKIVMAFVCFF